MDGHESNALASVASSPMPPSIITRMTRFNSQYLQSNLDLFPVPSQQIDVEARLSDPAPPTYINFLREMSPSTQLLISESAALRPQQMVKDQA